MKIGFRIRENRAHKHLLLIPEVFDFAVIDIATFDDILLILTLDKTTSATISSLIFFFAK